MTKVRMGIDLGTSYFKCGVFDATGELLGLGRVAVETDAPQAGWCELPAGRFWALLRTAVTQALAAAQLDAAAVEALSYGSQANSFLLLDGAGDSLTPLLLWPDRRADPLEPDLAAALATPEFAAAAGHSLVSPELMPAKLRWLRRELPGVWAATRHVLTLPEYFTFLLTGRRAGDHATAALTGLWDVPAGRWNEAFIERIGLGELLERDLLPELHTPGFELAKLPAEGAARLGLTPETCFFTGTLDHHAASLGAGVGAFAEASESNGTVLAVARVTPRFAPRAGVVCGPGRAGEFWELAFSGAGAGALERYAASAAPGVSLAELAAQAAEVPAGAGGLRLVTHDPLDFAGATRSMTRAHHVRAIFEAGARESARLLYELDPARTTRRLAATGGGARSDAWLQIKAAQLEVEVIRPICPESASLGAASLTLPPGETLARAERVFRAE